MATTLDPFAAAEGFRDVYTVSRLNREVRELLEGGFPLLWITGEISNLAQPGSGHWYFSLKDAAAQVRCAMFRSRNLRIGFTPDNGTQVLARVRVSLYENRGEFQLVVEHMEPAGDGALRLEFERLKKKLQGDGLFDGAHKLELPAFPKCVGIVSSPSGAAVRDIVSVLGRRFPALPIVLYPCSVQGDSAPPQIAEAIATADRRADCDVLILARGGGSLEDLRAFNDERVARAIYLCRIPLVTGIGHEIDFTIADLVADVRAPTPSASAELVSPEATALRAQVDRAAQRLLFRVRHSLDRRAQTLDWTRRRLIHPGRMLTDIARRNDGLWLRMVLAQRAYLRECRAALNQLVADLHHANPGARVSLDRQRTQGFGERLQRAARVFVNDRKAAVVALSRALDAVSPLATLGRGYAIVTRLADGRIIRRAVELQPADRIHVRLSEGGVRARVESTGEEDQTDF